MFSDGRCEAATVASVDYSVVPPSYGITFDATPGRSRETVAARLKPVISADSSHLACEGCKCPVAGCQSLVAASTLQVNPAVHKGVAVLLLSLCAYYTISIQTNIMTGS